MEIDGEAGAGLVRVTLNGKGDLRRIKIDPKLADPADIEMLEDLIVAAHRDAKSKIEADDRGGDAEGHRRPATAARDEAAVLVVSSQLSSLSDGRVPLREGDDGTRGQHLITDD